MGMFMRNKRNRQIPTLNTASLPDLIFTMLFFFMLVTNMRESTPQSPLDLPIGEHLDNTKDESLVHYIYIGVTEDGVDFVQLDDQLVSLPELEKRLSALSPNAPQATIALGIDGKVEMNRVEHIKQVLRKKKIPVIYYLGTESIVTYFAGKIYLLCIVAWLLTLCIYIYGICYKDAKKRIKKIIMFITIIFFVVGVVVFALPIYFNNEIYKIYSYGPSVQTVYNFSALAIVVWIIMIGKNFKQVKKRKCIPNTQNVSEQKNGGGTCRTVSQGYPPQVQITVVTATNRRRGTNIGNYITNYLVSVS